MIKYTLIALFILVYIVLYQTNSTLTIKNKKTGIVFVMGRE